MRIAPLVALTLAFTSSTPTRAQSAPTSPCTICCAAGLYCCLGVSPQVAAAFPWITRFVPVVGDVDVTAGNEAPLPRAPGLRAMAF